MSAPACGHRPWERGATDPRLVPLGLGMPALELASLGLKVFPVVRGGKAPHRMLCGLAPPGEGGYKLASADPAWVRWCWGQDPVAGIGVPTGLPNELVVGDFDRKHGIDGVAVFLGWMAQHGLALPPAPWARTPSGGGRHIWMRYRGGPLPGRSGGNPLLPGVDIKADGGYIVAPPSGLLVTPLRRPDEPRGAAPVPVPYTWGPGCCPCSLPEAPGWLTGAMAALPVPARAGGQPGTGGGSWHGDLPPTEELIARGLPPGGRNDLMQKLACRLWRQHGPEGAAAVLGTCRQVFGATDTADGGLDGEPFTWDEALGRIRSARVFITRDRAAEAALPGMRRARRGAR